MTLARIGKAHGLRGEMKLDLLGRTGELLEGSGRVYLGWSQLDARRIEIESLRGGPPRPLLKLRGVDTPEGARALTGARLFRPRSDFPTPAAGEYYWADLVGLRVLADGQPLGQVEEILETPAFDLLVVKQGGGAASDALPGVSPEEHLIPFTAAALQEVRLDEGVIRVHPPAVWEERRGEPGVSRREPGRAGGGKAKSAPGHGEGTRTEKSRE
ncbi:MAG: ribosome maturation factor RimM [Deltaproteobacteria bacterium]|nr:ribosome maturation factor RimM [Deltaproteobacteria bacterium]